METKLAKLATFCLLACSSAAQAQTGLTIYGNVDQYIGYIKSRDGESVIGLNDGAILRSRLGFRGTEDLGRGLQAKFNLETGFSADNGALADSGSATSPARLFDRQAWIGINTPMGEFRFGRQNTEIFLIGGAIDYTERTTFGSIVNTFGVPSRYENDISYKSPRIANIQVSAHYAVTEIPEESIGERAVYQLAVDYTNGPYRAGYAGIAASPAPTGPFDNKIQYHNLYGNYDYGRGKIYLVYVRSNNSTATANGNNAGTILSNVGSPNNYFPGIDPNVRRFYNIYQVSADYKLNPQLRVGALYGIMNDTDGDADARGGNVGAFYELSKRTTLYGFANYMKNENGAGFRFSGSAAPSANLVGPDINGKTLIGIQAGVLHRF